MGKHDGLKEIRKLDLHIKEARPFDEGVVKLNVIRRTFPRFSKSRFQVIFPLLPRSINSHSTSQLRTTQGRRSVRMISLASKVASVAITAAAFVLLADRRVSNKTTVATIVTAAMIHCASVSLEETKSPVQRHHQKEASPSFWPL
jgi:hypothetical protein